MIKKIKLKAKCWLKVESGEGATVRITMLRGKECLVVRYKTDHGRIKRKYYPLAELKDANAFARIKNAEYKRHGAIFGAITPDEARAIETWRAYRKNRINAGREYKEPAALMHEAVELDNKREITPPVEAVIDQYLHHMMRQEKSLRHYETTRRNLNMFKGIYKGREIGSLTTAEMENTLLCASNVRTGAPLSPVTLQSRRLALCGLFSFALRRGLIEKNAAVLIETPDIKRMNAPGIITVETARTILQDIADNAPQYLKVFALALFLGVRKAELTRLYHKDVDLTRNEVTITKQVAKTGKARYIPIPECAQAWLNLVPEPESPDELLIPGDNEEKREKRYQKATTTMKKRTGIELPRNAFRHSAASYLCALMEDLPKCALYLGHSVNILNQNYRNAVPHDAGVAYYNIFPQ